MKTILVVDDSSICLDIVEAWLLDNGYKVLTAKNGKDGYNLCKQHKPDAVILDIQMPDMYGSEVAEAIKNDASISNTPIIYNTGIVERQDVPKGNLICGQYVIAKPFDGDELREILQKVL
jgi:two-component system, OmpR family, alkaline phosphatase synthesis response regulator PhoP